jgi:O-antigen/teichoic acid export membrane protein
LPSVDYRTAVLGSSLWNFTAFLISAAVNLVTLPFVVAHLGITSFGIAGLVTACVAPSVVFGGTLIQMTTRELALTRAPDGHANATQLLGTALFLAGTGGLVIALALVALGPPFAKLIFNLQDVAEAELSASFLFAALAWASQLLAGLFFALFVARQNYRVSAVGTMTASIVTAVAIFSLVPIRPQPSTFLACQAAGFAASCLVAFVAARVSYRDWIPLPLIHGLALRQLFRTGSWQALAQLGGQISAQSDRYLLGAFLSPQSVGFYNVAQRLEEAVYIGILKLGETLFPFFSARIAGDSQGLGDVFFRSCWFLNMIAASALGGLIPVAGDLLRVWTNAAVASEAELVLVILSIAGILGSAANVLTFFLLAAGKTRALALLSWSSTAVILLTAAIALPLFGWPAAGWSTLMGMTTQLIIGTFLLGAHFKTDGMWARIAHSVLVPLGTAVLLALILRHLAGHIALSGWLHILVAYAVSAGIICAAIVMVSIWGKAGHAARHDLLFVTRRLLFLRSA